MALTKEILETYLRNLEGEKQTAFVAYQAVDGAIQVTRRYLRYLELEVGGADAVTLEEILGVNPGQ